MRFALAFIATSALLLVTSHAQAQDAAAGEKIFTRCKACHEAEADKNKVGPSLKGVLGRKAGSHEGFKYSNAMQEAGQKGMVWDEANITSYLKDPKGFIPGNKMVFPGLKKDDEIANVIAYLKEHP
jgi:cytochrome c